MGRILKTVAFAGVGYLAFLVSLLFEPVQRNLVFLYRIRLGSKETLYHPESVGFAHNQAAPFWLPTPDGEKLLGWHILPLDVYDSHRHVLRNRIANDETIENGELLKGHLEILKEDPDARVIIYYHGNSGCISAIHRPDIYRALLSTSPAHTHVFIVDYRGFGISTGVPSEEALISDGVVVAKEIVRMTGVPPSSTILVGQSLGTGVIIGVADKLALESPATEFRAIVPIAGFASVEELLSTYKIFGVVPILAPFRQTKSLERFFSSKLLYKFHSDERMERFIRNTRTSKVLVVHSFNDEEIPFYHGEKLVAAAISGAVERGQDLSLQKLVGMQEHERDDRFRVVNVGLEQAREYVFTQRFDNSTEPTSGGVSRRISMLAVKWGGHNVVPKSTDVVLAIREILYDD